MSGTAQISPVTEQEAALALGRLIAWFDTMRTGAGHGGPVVGLRGVSMACCMAGFDWRWEGLLDGWIELHRRTGEPVWLDRMDEALRAIASAGLANGAFRNSSFEFNPFEGGMPHEPAMIAAALRARARLVSEGRTPPPEFDEAAARFVAERLVRELWSKLLRTFKNWMQSDFERCTPSAVAAAVEVLDAWTAISGDAQTHDAHLEGAGASLLAAQIRNGPAAGGFPSTHPGPASANPYLSARILPALERLFARTNDVRYSECALRLIDFLRRHARRSGGFPLLVHTDRPVTSAPLFVGATAGVLVALRRAGQAGAVAEEPHVRFVLAHQSAAGGFDTAEGFDAHRGAAPDWRDVVPVCGWADKIHHLLAMLAGRVAPAGATGRVSRPVRVRGVEALYEEDDGRMRISGEDRIHFDWHKGRPWADGTLP